MSTSTESRKGAAKDSATGKKEPCGNRRPFKTAETAKKSADWMESRVSSRPYKFKWWQCAECSKFHIGIDYGA